MVTKTDQSAAPAGNEEETDVTSSAAASTAGDDNTPDSSTGQGDDNETMLDAINKAAEDTGSVDEDAPAADADEDGEKSGDEKSEDDPDADAEGEVTDKKSESEKQKTEDDGEEEDDNGEDVAEGQKIPYNRFKKVIDQRNQVKEQLSDLTQQVDTYKQGYDQFQAIEGFMSENSLSKEDVAEALHISALMATDPAEAAKLLTPKMQKLQQFTGEILPDDLQEKVDTGEIDEQTARDYARTRNQNRHLQQQTTQQRQAQQQREQQTRQRAVQQEMATAANAAQQALMQSDPDFKVKAPMVRDRLQVLISQERPATAEAAKKLVNQAHADVTKALRNANGGKPDINPSPSSNNAGSSNTSAREKEPETMQEAISRAVNN